MLSGAVFFILALLAFCDLISEQAILSSLPFLPISRELKVQTADLILTKSSGALLGHCHHPHCPFPVVSPLVPARNGPVHMGHMLCFIHRCSLRPPEPLCSFRHWLSMVTGPKKPETTPSSGSAPAPDTGPACGIREMMCCLSWHLPTFTGFFCILKCTLSPQRYFPYLVSNLSELKLRLETRNFSCLGVMELEPLTSGDPGLPV